MSLCVLLGNGVSVTANPELRLDRLTETFLNAHAADREDLDRLLAEVDLGHLDPERDFEGVVAALESAEAVITAFMGLARRARHPQLTAAADLLDQHGVPGLVRRLYYAYCAEVLDAIGERTRGDLPPSLIAFGDWLKALYEAHGTADIFTLNYDLLLERMLIDADVLGLQAVMTDLFSGLQERSVDEQLVDGIPVLHGHMFFPADPPSDRTIHLYHLHGCLTHFRRESDGLVVKFTSGDVRNHGIFRLLAEGASSTYTPAVILGSRKVEKAAEWPFAYSFLALQEAAKRARTIIIAGYSFRDEAVNQRLRSLAAGRGKRWIVIDHQLEAAAVTEFTTRVERATGDDEVEFVLSGLGSDLPAVR